MGRSASAQVYAYTSQSGYDNATQSTVESITFNAQTPNYSTVTSYPSGLSVGGVEFTAEDANLAVVGPTSGGDYMIGGDSTPFLDAKSSSGTTDIDALLPADVPPSGVSAVGTQIEASVSAAQITALITLVNGTTASYVYNSPNTGLGFLGFVSTGDAPGDAIESVSFSDAATDGCGSQELAIDNFTYGVVDTTIPSCDPGLPLLVTPEPRSLALLAVGGIALLFFRRRFLATR